MPTLKIPPPSVPTLPSRPDGDCNGTSMTPDEFDGVEDCDRGYRYELVRGAVIVNPIPNEPHGDPIDELGYLLRAYQKSHPQGPALDATLPGRYVRTSTGRQRIRPRSPSSSFPAPAGIGTAIASGSDRGIAMRASRSIGSSTGSAGR